MKKILLVVFVFVLSVAQSQVIQDKNPRPEKVYNSPKGHGIGAVLSSSNGKGLAYRYWPRRFGFHVSFFPLANNEEKYYNGGVTGYLTLREYEHGTLFIHAGAEYQYTSQLRNANQNFISSPTYHINTNGLNFGAGPGISVKQKFVTMDLFLGYGVYGRSRTTDDPTQMVHDDTVVTLTGGVAFFILL